MKLSKYCCGMCKYYTVASITLDGLWDNYFFCNNKKAKDSYELKVNYGDNCDEWESGEVGFKEAQIKEEPFSWNDNLSKLAQEDFKQVQDELPYEICSSIGMALAKLEILEAQGTKVEEETLTVNGF